MRTPIQQYQTVYGQPSKQTGETRHHTHADALLADGARTMTDPRTDVSRYTVESLSRVPLPVLEAEARAIGQPSPQDHHNPAGMNDTSIRTNQQTRASVLAGLFHAQSMSSKQLGTHESHGEAGRLARAMEGTGLNLHAKAKAEGSVQIHEHARLALTIAAAAHNIGARQAASSGFDVGDGQGSVVQAAMFQGRHPTTVAKDLVQHRVLDASDPRAHITREDLSKISTQEALDRASPERPMGRDAIGPEEAIKNGGLTLARRAEAKAMALFADTTGNTADLQARRAQAQSMLVGAFAVAAHRQELTRPAESAMLITTHPARRQHTANEER